MGRQNDQTGITFLYESPKRKVCVVLGREKVFVTLLVHVLKLES